MFCFSAAEMGLGCMGLGLNKSCEFWDRAFLLLSSTLYDFLTSSICEELCN